MGATDICNFTVFFEGGQASQVALDGRSLIIGRDPGCDVRLDHYSVSRRHARLFRTETAWFISDLGSTNGTIVNGSRITEKWLKPGDVVRLGAYKVRFGGKAAAPTSARKQVVRPKDLQGAESRPTPAPAKRIELSRYREECPNARLEGAYPRIWDEIMQEWGTPGCERYLRNLIYTERVGRAGFSLEVMSELLCLLNIVQKGTRAVPL